ncbi:hypothetical protein [Blastopirellula marina]|nr:hypothetical protein [Blastopirellula marina]
MESNGQDSLDADIHATIDRISDRRIAAEEESYARSQSLIDFVAPHIDKMTDENERRGSLMLITEFALWRKAEHDKAIAEIESQREELRTAFSAWLERTDAPEA